MPARVLDATITECVLWARQPLGRDLLEALPECAPLPGCDSAVPVLPGTAYGADLLMPLTQTAVVLEPLTRSAHAIIVDDPPQAEACLVDPHGVPLGDPFPELPTPPGWTRECVAWLPAGPFDGACFDRVLRHLPDAARLRLLDPHGILRPDTLAPILDHPEAHLLTLGLENAHGLALATAHTALQRRAGPTVRTSLLGIGRRTGPPPTELLLAADADRLRPYAERAALVSGYAIPAQHPLWGRQRHEAAEPERLGEPPAEPRWNPGTIPLLLEDHLDDFGIRVDADTLARLTDALIARLRPGERPDGPTLYAFLATHMDIARATRNEGPA